MKLVHESSQIVFPLHTNDRGTIFGGDFMAVVDLVVAQHVMWLLYEHKSDCQDAVLVSFHIDFHDKAVVGDLLTIRSTVDKIGIKSMSFLTEAKRIDGRVMATGRATYISRKDAEPHKHGIPMFVNGKDKLGE